MRAQATPAEILVATTTVADEAAARALARALVEARLAACVQLEPITASVYRWEGRLCEEPEWRLVIKTATGAAAALEAGLARLHPYQVPQFTAQRAAASAAYAAWVAEQVG